MASMPRLGQPWEAYEIVPPLLGVLLVQVSASGIDPCVVDENVRIPELGFDLCEQICNRLCVGNVSCDREGLDCWVDIVDGSCGGL
jgi:hypothetical protein